MTGKPPKSPGLSPMRIQLQQGILKFFFTPISVKKKFLVAFIYF